MRDWLWRIRRAWGLLSLYWSTEDCDWSVAASLFRYQLARIREHILEHNIVSDAERIGREISVVVELLDRMIDGTSYTIAAGRYPNRGHHWSKMIREIEGQQIEMLATMLRRRLRCWWD